MNCKPGDLAVTVGMLDGNNGMIVEVIEGTDCGKGWVCKAMRKVKGDADTNKPRMIPAGAPLIIADVNLRPISGVPVDDEVTDCLARTRAVLEPSNA